MNILAIFSCCLCMLSLVPGSSAVCHRRVCLYYNKGRIGVANLDLDNVEPTLCTHIIYAVPCPKGGCQNVLSTIDENILTKLNNLKKQNPELKTLLSIGEWKLGSAPFTHLVSSAVTRKKLIPLVIQFLREHTFDGFDVLWFHPPAYDNHTYATFIQELRVAFEVEATVSKKPRLLLSTFVSHGVGNMKGQLPAINRNVDMLNVLTVDMQGIWPGHTAHTSPLYFHKGQPSQNSRSVESVLNAYVGFGVTKDKINVGLTAKGRSFTLTDKSKNGAGAKVKGHGAAGKYLKAVGQLTYYEICEMLTEGAAEKWIIDQQVPYLVNKDQWVGYEDQMSIAIKAAYINIHGYGGWVLSMLDYDDFTGTFCKQGSFPLTNAAKNLCDASKSKAELDLAIQSVLLSIPKFTPASTQGQ